jgi:hypothetical protein
LQSIILTLGPAEFNRDGVALDVPGLVQALAESSQTSGIRRANSYAEIRSPALLAVAPAP